MAQFVELLVQRHDFDLGLEVHLIVVAGIDAVALGLAVLRHHDDRRLKCGIIDRIEVEEDVGVGIERVAPEQDELARRPEDQESEEGQR